MTGRRLAGLRPIMLVVAVLAAACSSGSSDIERSASDSDGAASAAPEVSPEEGEAGSAEAGPLADGTTADDVGDDGFTPNDERVYPLRAFVGELTDELFPGWDDEHPMVVIENSTHACMTGQGFRYTEIDWLAMEAEGRANTPVVSDEEYMTANGYGFADSLDAPEVQHEYKYVDPNEAIRNSLSEGELAAWWSQEGTCRAVAQDEATRHSVVRWALQDDQQRVNEAVAADPRIAAAIAEWSSCMAAHGHHYADRDELFRYLQGLANPLYERLLAMGHPDELDAAYQADVDALKAIEVKIARADLECREPLEQVQYEVEVEHQQRYLDENQDRLALLREELPTMTLPPGAGFYFQ